MASKPAVALIVAGSGSVSEAEVFDLLEDRFPESAYSEVGLVVPIDKDLYTDAVKFAVKWFGDEKAVIPVQTKGATAARGTKTLGDEDSLQEVSKFEDVLDQAEFPDWDEVYFIVAIPTDAEDPAYELYAELVEAAQEKGISVMDLTAGLDDVILVDEEEEPEAEPEPPKEEKPAPARRSRARKTVEPDPEVEKEIAKIEEEPEVTQPVVLPKARLNDRDVLAGFLAAVAKAADHALELLYSPEEDPAPQEEPEPVADSSRGRGRPRTNFEVKQILDEDENEWIPRPKGRMRKGTQWRTIHVETNEVLDSGTAGE